MSEAGRTDFEKFSRLLSYDPETGNLRWAVARQRIRKGQIAGTRHSSGCVAVEVAGKRYMAHRVCWLLVHGVWPERDIDHANRNPSDNRLCNLRLATDSQNNANRVYSRKKSGLPKGVRVQRKRFGAAITVNGKSSFLGTFPTIEEASRAYEVAAKKAFGEFARVA
jgi:hypothetical protein